MTEEQAGRKRTLTIIVPTIGRQTLTATLSSFAPELAEGDQIHVVDDRSPTTNNINSLDIQGLVKDHSRYSLGDWTYWHPPHQGDWGHGARNHVLDNLETVDTDYLWTIDDDDTMRPGSLGLMRNQAANWIVFKMHFGPGHPAHGITCWRESRLRYGDIGTPMHVAKPCKARFGRRYEGDWDYAQALQQEFGEPLFLGNIIADIRPVADA